MRPSHCVACQRRDLYHTTIEVESGGIILRIGLSGKVLIKCSVCLSCRAIAPYIEAGELDKLRSWKKQARKAKAIVSQP
jgi:hypothetical protein